MAEQYTPSVVISLDNLLHNLRQIRLRLSDTTDVLAVVKDCCYGCGMHQIAKTLQEEGQVNCFAVATTSEALSLRRNGICGTILILGKATAADLRIGTEHQLTFTCTGTDDLVRWRQYAIPVNFHVEIDTGMRRLGLQPSDLPVLIDELRTNPQLRLSGTFTHMASADVPGTETVDIQCAEFRAALATLGNHAIDPGMIHVANSATILRFPPYCPTHVRPGIILYGCKPDPTQDFGIDLRPIVSLYGSVVSLRNAAPDTAVSYGGHYRTSRGTTIATIGIGYAHGVPRYLSNRGNVLINGKRYRIAGNVTMDYIMADVGPDAPITVGDTAVIIGSQGTETITPDDIAIIGNTIGYEVLCNIGPNIKRTYTLNGAVIGSADVFLY